MNKVITKRSLTLSLLLYLLGSSYFLQAHPSNSLLRVEYDFDSYKNGSAVQWGTCTFCFEQDPIITYIPNLKEKNRMVFFFPYADISKSMYASIIKVFAEYATDFLTLSIEKVTNPIEGLQLTIQYNPHNISVDKQIVRSFDLTAGVMFNFFNKEVLEQLKGKDVPLLTIS